MGSPTPENHAFQSGHGLDQLTARVFRVKGETIRFHAHQAQAIAKARARQSFVVTTGTGSGKSLCFFVPIIDAAIRAKKERSERRTRAIIVYPMNALANSQIKEIEKVIAQADLPDHLRPSVKRYTGRKKRRSARRSRRTHQTFFCRIT